MNAPTITKTNWVSVGWNVANNATTSSWTGLVSAAGKWYTITKRDYLATNLIINGSFENNFTGWSVFSSFNISTVRSHNGSKSAYLNTNQDTSLFLSPISNISIIKDNIYYVFVQQYLTRFSGGNGTIFYLDTWNSPKTNAWFGLNTSILNSWIRMSTRFIAQGSHEVIDLRLGHAYDVFANFDVYFDSYGIINLTQIFGAGNEPSLDWCNSWINWFEGTSTLTAYNNIN